MILELVLGGFGWRLGAPVGRWKKHVFGEARKWARANSHCGLGYTWGHHFDMLGTSFWRWFWGGLGGGWGHQLGDGKNMFLAKPGNGRGPTAIVVWATLGVTIWVCPGHLFGDGLGKVWLEVGGTSWEMEKACFWRLPEMGAGQQPSWFGPHLG